MALLETLAQAETLANKQIEELNAQRAKTQDEVRYLEEKLARLENVKASIHQLLANPALVASLDGIPADVNVSTTGLHSRLPAPVAEPLKLSEEERLMAEMPLTALVKEILTRAGEPLRLRDIEARIRALVPSRTIGETSTSVAVAHLGGDPDSGVIKIKYGVYGLKAWDLPSKPEAPVIDSNFADVDEAGDGDTTYVSTAQPRPSSGLTPGGSCHARPPQPAPAPVEQQWIWSAPTKCTKCFTPNVRLRRKADADPTKDVWLHDHIVNGVASGRPCILPMAHYKGIKDDRSYKGIVAA